MRQLSVPMRFYKAFELFSRAGIGETLSNIYLYLGISYSQYEKNYRAKIFGSFFLRLNI